jgi:hypothetical protein
LRIVALTLALAVAPAALAQSLTLSGACPGPVDITVTGVTPGASVIIVAGSGVGSTPIPAGGCAGVDTGLDGPLRKFGPLRDADRDGVVNIRPTIPRDVCGQMLVAVDSESCGVSAPRGFGGDAEPFDNELWVDGYAYAAIDDAPVYSAYGDWINTCQTDPYPLPEGWEIVPNFPGVEDIIYTGAWGTHCMLVEAGCTYGTSNYSYGNCYEPCGLMGDDGAGNYWATSCSRRVMIRRPL